MQLPKTIQNVLSDHKSGSVLLLKKLTRALEIELLHPETDPLTYISWLKTIRGRMKMFSVVKHFCDEMIMNIEVSSRPTSESFAGWISKYNDYWEQSPKHIADSLAAMISGDETLIMVHSNSHTLTEVFHILKERSENISFIQTLSAPLEEGRIQARNLAEMGYRITLVTDASAAGMMNQANLVVLGADQVGKDSIVNKIGSLSLALAAREYNVPVIVLTESRKIYEKEDVNFIPTLQDPSEVLCDTQHPKIESVNIYFEELPRHLVDHLITERGVISGKK